MYFPKTFLIGSLGLLLELALAPAPDADSIPVQSLIGRGCLPLSFWIKLMHLWRLVQMHSLPRSRSILPIREHYDYHAGSKDDFMRLCFVSADKEHASILFGEEWRISVRNDTKQGIA